MGSTRREKFFELRKQAEEKLESSKIKTIQDEEIRDLVQELRVHQIELEMQNLELDKANKELEAAQAQLKTDYIDLYDFAPVGYCTFDKDGKILKSNLTLADFLKVSRSELRKASFYDYIHEEDKDTFYLFLRKIYEKQSKNSCELRLITDTTEIYVQLQGVIDASGDCRAALMDITDRKRTERKLRFQAQLLDSVQESVIATDMEGAIIYWGKGAEALYGYRAEEVMGKSVEFIVEPEKREAEAYRMQQVLEKGSWKGEYIQKRKDGTKFWGETFIALVLDEHGNPNGMIGIDRDITERKQAEKALRESEQTWRDSFNSLEDTMLIIDRDFTIENINQNGLDLLGLPREKVIGKKCYKLIHGSDQPVEDCPFIKMLESRKVESWEWYEEIFDRYFSMKGSPIYDENGDIIKFVDLMRDITELKRTEQKLQEANATKDQFFSIISHDIKNPLVSLIYGNEMILENWETIPKQRIRHISEEMWNSSNQLLTLLQELIKWAKFQRGKLEFQPRTVDLYYLVISTVQLLNKVAAPKEISLKNTIDREAHRVVVDCNMIKTVLRNLITNAIKFSEAGGEITISAAENGGFVEVSVSDTGVGMSPEKVARLFQLGERDISTEGTAGEKGTGLGLLLCKDFVEKHGGEIWVDSQEGVGSTFTFSLPKDDDASEV
jgi:PAS domain S-box-containing protein